MMRLARCRFSVGIIPTTGNRQPTTRRSRNHLRLDRLRVRADIDLDLLRLRFLELRDLDLEDAVTVLRGDGVRVDSTRQRERPREGAIRPLDAVVVAVFLLLELAFAADGEQAILEADLQIAFLHPGHFDAHQNLVLLFGDVDSRRPGSRLQLILEEVEAAEKGLEETGLKRTEVFEGIGGSGNKCHRSLLYRDMSLSRSYHH